MIKMCTVPLLSYFVVIALYYFFFDKVCPDHISETIGIRVMKLHMLIELDERMCSDKDV